MKQHQLVVTKDEVSGAYNKMRQETLHVFAGGDLFKGVTKDYTPGDAEGDQLPPEKKNVVTTVKDRLEWTEKSVCAMLDFEASRDKTNQKAVADLEVDGVLLYKALPVPFLLSLETKLQEIRAYYDAAPTLDLAKDWTKEGNGIFKNGPHDQGRYLKKTRPVEMSKATDKHPAQIQAVIDDVRVGTWTTTYRSGESHPGEKAEWLGRIDKLIAATKKARMKANETEVEPVTVGKSLFDFIHGRK
jgi:hypothetical protein